jgi:hypothetical protein
VQTHTTTIVRISYDLPAYINADRIAAWISIQAAQISHHAVLPEKCVMCLAPGQIGPADNEASVGDRHCV